mmetsp:Transcript_93015/g.248959  ORF Transcript_93015/g.248959 Transcript_93015/m.248959 type:complete len:235 (+) Transcript_93015:613-1317(+)
MLSHPVGVHVALHLGKCSQLLLQTCNGPCCLLDGGGGPVCLARQLGNLSFVLLLGLGCLRSVYFAPLMLISISPLLLQDPAHHVPDQTLDLGEDIVPGPSRGGNLRGQQRQGGVTVAASKLAQHLGNTVEHIIPGTHLHQAIRLLASAASHILDHLLGIGQSLQLLLPAPDTQLVVRGCLHTILLHLPQSVLVRLGILIGHGEITVGGGQGLTVPSQALLGVGQLLVFGLQLVS